MIHTVPFQRQITSKSCGEACISMAANHAISGKGLSADVARKKYSQIKLSRSATPVGLTGEIMMDFVDNKFKVYGEALSLPVWDEVATFDIVNSIINDGMVAVVIQQVTPSFGKAHGRLVVGTDQGDIICHDPDVGPNRRFTITEFCDLSTATGTTLTPAMIAMLGYSQNGPDLIESGLIVAISNKPLNGSPTIRDRIMAQYPNGLPNHRF